jgi:hypothetical protein
MACGHHVLDEGWWFCAFHTPYRVLAANVPAVCEPCRPEGLARQVRFHLRHLA